MSAACSRGDLRQARPPHPTTTPPPPRSPRLAYAAEPCDKEIDQARPSPTDPADLPRYHRRGDPRHRHCGPAGGRKAGRQGGPPCPPPHPRGGCGGGLEGGGGGSRQQHEDTDDCQHTTWPCWLIESPGWLVPAWRAIHRGHASKTFTKDAHEQAPDP